ncbi:MAG TPA: RNA polymerase sigma factor [Bacteroidota bacterium]|nr:RNA polymerase sigma factor [Bacteroidota bacterium]
MMNTDRAIASALSAGDERAFTALYHRYKGQMYRFCLRMTSDADAAGDIVQGVFIKVFERHAQLQHAERLRAWLYTIARNDCLTHIRTAGKQIPLGERAEYGPGDGEVYDRAEDRTIITEAIGRLIPEQREVILLREYEGMSYTEIAEVLGIAPGLVKSRIFSARRKLFELLKPMFSERVRK